MNLREAIERIPATSFSGTVHRIYDHAHGFLETIGSYLNGGRWNRKHLYGALYTSLSYETALAEVRRGAEKRNLIVSDLGRRDHVEIRVRLHRVLDLTSPEFCRSLGISPEKLLQDEDLCLRIADEARAAGYEALKAPSATGLGTNLVIFQDRLTPGWQLEEIQRTEDVLGKK